jgi:hypothetical protein
MKKDGTPDTAEGTGPVQTRDAHHPQSGATEDRTAATAVPPSGRA